MKKFLALVIVGSMVAAMPVLAAPSPSAAVVVTTPSAVENAAGDKVVVTPEIKAAAAQANLTPVEYVNNIVATVPGLPDVKPIAQGGHVVINGVKTAAVLNLTKPSAAQAKVAAATAAQLGGKALSFVGLKPGFQFNKLGVNFAIAGVKSGANIVAFQLVDGKWVPVKVNSVKDNFVDVTLTGAGELLLVELNK